MMILQQPLFLYYVKQSLFCRVKVRDNLSRLLFVFVEHVDLGPFHPIIMFPWYQIGPDIEKIYNYSFSDFISRINLF